MTKHVVAPALQQAAAIAGYGPRTFVAQADTLTAAVDANIHNFPDGVHATSNPRFDFNVSLPVYLWTKTNHLLPGGQAEGQPVALAINGVPTNCTIGVTKKAAQGGAHPVPESVSITHFQTA